MISIIVLVLPAVLSVWLWEIFSKKHLSGRSWIYLLSLNVMLINLGIFAVKRWVLNTAANPLSAMAQDMTPLVAMNYLLMAIPAAIALAAVERFVHSKVRIFVESDENDVPENQEKA